MPSDAVPDSRIVVTRRGEAAVFSVPPVGYHWRNVLRVLLGGLFLLASLAHVWSFSQWWGSLTLAGPGFARLGWFVLLLFFCWFNGLGLIVLALLHASRRATLIVRGCGLRIVEDNAHRVLSVGGTAGYLFPMVAFVPVAAARAMVPMPHMRSIDQRGLPAPVWTDQ